jgi:hypothetical protein
MVYIACLRFFIPMLFAAFSPTAVGPAGFIVKIDFHASLL